MTVRLVVAFALVAVASANIAWTQCYTNAPIPIKFHAEPWPPVAGQPFTLSFTLRTLPHVKVSNYTYTVAFNEEEFVSQHGLLSDPTDQRTWKQTILLPEMAPGFLNTHRYQIFRADRVPVECFEANINAEFTKERMALDANFLMGLNRMQTHWQAGFNSIFARKTFEHAKRLMGVKRKGDHVRPPVAPAFPPSVIARLPAHVGKGNCTGPVLDQANCGSCWAFGAVEAISDRLCMKRGVYLALSPLDLVTCDSNDGGCEGGDPYSAWSYAQSTGLVTEACYPYLQSNGGPIPTCAPTSEPCLNFVDTPPCTSTCSNNATFGRDKHMIQSVYSVSGVDQIAAEIATHGSVEAAFTVYADFLNYKSGVYSYTTGDELGGHAVKLIGYGTENGVDYWLAQNSWTTTWGDNGMFKIRKGTDECGIEDDIVAGTV